MSVNLSADVLEDVDGTWFRLLQPLICTVVDEGLYIEVVVPAGFQTDLASVPRFFWRVFPRSGLWNPAAIIHDYLYSLNCKAITRSGADAIFYELMRVRGVRHTQALLMWFAVRTFGWTGWRKRK